MKKINWIADEAARKVGIPERLTGGVVDTVAGVGKVVRFAEQVGGKRVCLRVDTRPELAAEIARIEAEEVAAELAAKEAALAKFEAAKISGEAFRTAEIPAQYEPELHWARHAAPGEGYAPEVLFGFSGSPRVIVARDAIRQVVGERRPDGTFPGCSNSAWIISETEWDQIIALSAQITARKIHAQADYEAAEAADIERKIAAGFCFACETYCHGDCGHYSPDPMVKHRRDLRQAGREANYGIND